MSQETEILNALQRGEQLTVLDAIQRYGCYALSQRCTTMIRAGLPIRSEMITLPNKKRVAKYSWAGE